jgi:hypothetical protein
MTRLSEEGFLIREGDLLWISPGQRDDEGYTEDP